MKPAQKENSITTTAEESLHNLKIFCCNVHYLRIYHNLTQKQMADIIGISVSTLRKLEAGSLQVRVNCSMLYRICEHFQISADVILSETLDLTHS